MRWPQSLQRRLLALVLGVVTLVWAGTAVLTWTDVSHELDELLDSHLAQAAALLVVQQVQEFEGEEDDRGVDAPTLHRYAPKVAFQVFHEGRLVLRSSNAPPERMATLQEGFRTAAIAGVSWRVFAARGADRDVQVYVGEQTRSRADILWAALGSMLWPMALALPLLALAAGWAIHQGVAPLRRLARALAERQPQSLQPLALPQAPSEMQPVLDALNALFERIGQLLDAERRFTADAAHELRTPIAAIRTQAQVALGEAEPGARRHALLATLEGCDRATRLVEQMLTLARLEAASAPPGQVVDLAALARRVMADLAPRALAQGQALELDADTPCPVAGDETLLAVLLRNLLDNAIRYCPAGATIHAAVARTGNGVELLVEDSGPGLADADQARLGQRFFRVPGSAASGSGLGWSIVYRIAAVHGLALTVGRSVTLGGLAVRVQAPADQAA
ncbi:Histidine kinase [Rubrivivax sp. A210]|uniref:ATP-binding protein n=1 Tax=Rubrivivax sp. A210 TaxID=2772301 RepID=UPI001917F837|nr:ATP-binding protein [Rubrivivax sp. A210]CAD5374359.1 Histidine kinase [Rubrivivax sp. A210]